ncbi:MAG: FAD-dependent oxidoreductase [Bacteroidota bacterium]|nr:FAD-dependent oxidoreductase [Bacteroidota bacterium]
MNQIKHEIFDAIIIGVGQSGSPLALALAEKDYKVALVERNKVGGSCINYGCTPSKTMMASAKVAEVVRLAGDYGIEANISKIHLNKIVERKEKIVNQFRKGILNGIEKEDFIELIRGEAKFSSEKSIKVDVEGGQSRFIKAEKIFINTGSRPDIPEIKGLSSIDYLDSTSIMELKSIPEHLLILGGSYIGLEFGQMFKRFGSKITVIEHGDQLVSREDQDIAEELQKILEEEGMDIYLNASVKK